MEKTRHFIVDTSVGQLAIYAKHDTWAQKRKGVDDLYKHLFRNK